MSYPMAVVQFDDFFSAKLDEFRTWLMEDRRKLDDDLPDAEADPDLFMMFCADKYPEYEVE